MAKPRIDLHISDAGKGLAQLMRDKLNVIADDMINQVSKKSRKLTQSQKHQAVKGLTPRGVLDYKDSIKTALSVIALSAIKQAKTEVPNKSHIKLCEEEDSITLAEFDKLPKSLQNKIKTQTDLLVGKQIGDLQKVIEFSYANTEEETDSNDKIDKDMSDSAIGWIDSTSMDAGADLYAAKMINSARQAFFFEPDVLEEIEALLFNNSDPVSPICQDLAGTVFAADDPDADQYYPPLHWNCKSFITVILVGNLDAALKESGQENIVSLAPSTKELKDSIQFHEHKNCCQYFY